jgi:ferredoxin
MKAFVDKELCIGCGLCESICPKVFKMDDNGLAEAVSEDLDPEQADGAKEAEAECPVRAIKTRE